MKALSTPTAKEIAAVQRVVMLRVVSAGLIVFGTLLGVLLLVMGRGEESVQAARIGVIVWLVERFVLRRIYDRLPAVRWVEAVRNQNAFGGHVLWEQGTEKPEGRVPVWMRGQQPPA